MTTPNVGKDMEQEELSLTAIRNVKCYNHFGNKCGCFFKGVIQLPYDPASILPYIYLPKRVEKVQIPTKTCIQILILPSFLINKNWKQLKCPSARECMNTLVYSYIPQVGIISKY